MRNRFDQQLTEMNQQLIEMGACCEECINQVAIAGTITGDANRSEDGEPLNKPVLNKVYSTDADIDRLEREIEGKCLRLLLEQQPVARDLRAISAALKMISDMERIGDQCSDIADIINYLNDAHIETIESSVHVQDMATATMKMVTKAVDSFIQKDLQMAKDVQASDDEVDDLFNKVKSEVVDLIAKYPDKGESLLDLLMIAKYFERIGDHSTNIAEWVEFSITGEHEKKLKYQD